MKNIQKIFNVFFMITLMSTFAVQADEDFDMIEPDDYADSQEGKRANLQKQEEEIRNAKPVKQPENPDLQVRATAKRGIFDRISDWSTKRTLNKIFTDHAKNNSTDGLEFFTKDNQPTKIKQMLDSLSSKDQNDLVNEFSKTRQETVKKELSTDRKKYENSLKAYEAHDKKEILADIDRTKKEIEKIDQKIANTKEELNKATTDTRKRTLVNKIARFEKLKNAQEEIEKDALTSIAEELNDRAEKHTASQESIIKNHIEKMQNFIDSINNNPGSLVTATMAKASEPTLEPESTNSQPEEEGNTALTQDEIKNLTDAELTERINEIVDRNPGSFNYDPEYKKLEAEEKLRKALNSQPKSSILDIFDFPNDLNRTSSSSSVSSENLDALKKKSQNWSYDEIEEAIRSGQYSSAAKKFLINELPENKRSKFTN